MFDGRSGEQEPQGGDRQRPVPETSPQVKLASEVIWWRILIVDSVTDPPPSSVLLQIFQAANSLSCPKATTIATIVRMVKKSRVDSTKF